MRTSSPTTGNRHDLREIHLPIEDPGAARAADVIFRDSIVTVTLRKLSLRPLLASPFEGTFSP
jgi:hypothetical protein